MVFFITFLRALAAMIITNSHYTGVYPNDIIANGGLLGNVIFFAVSGYCLTNISLPFFRWYRKRLLRIGIPVLLATAIFAATGIFHFYDFRSFFELFIFPTKYVFVAEIVVLYIPYYFVMKTEALRKRLPLVIAAVFALELIVYFTFFDRSTYHIDVVDEFMILFLYFITMLIGGYVKLNDEKYRNRLKAIYPVGALIFAALYFASKTFFVRYSADAFVCQFQIINQVALIILLYFVFVTFAGLDKKLDSMPKWLKTGIAFVGERTLDIYLVQRLIPVVNIGVSFFPLNWFIITLTIAASAIALHFLADCIYKLIDKKH